MWSQGLSRWSLSTVITLPTGPSAFGGTKVETISPLKRRRPQRRFGNRVLVKAVTGQLEMQNGGRGGGGEPRPFLGELPTTLRPPQSATPRIMEKGDFEAVEPKYNIVHLVPYFLFFFFFH